MKTDKPPVIGTQVYPRVEVPKANPNNRPSKNVFRVRRGVAALALGVAGLTTFATVDGLSEVFSSAPSAPTSPTPYLKAILPITPAHASGYNSSTAPEVAEMFPTDKGDELLKIEVQDDNHGGGTITGAVETVMRAEGVNTNPNTPNETVNTNVTNIEIAEGIDSSGGQVPAGYTFTAEATQPIKYPAELKSDPDLKITKAPDYTLRQRP